jgi:glyoxylase-like metal-dependent hydrolase (beta-lactamase superfamily II)
MKNLLLVVICVVVGISASAQERGGGRGPQPDPFVPENATVKLAARTYAIPDNNIGGVPNVGIVVGTRATLVIDPGMGRANGERVLREVAKVSKNSELYIASTHFHAEHTTGYHAFPPAPAARYINSTTQEAEFAEQGAQFIKNFAGQSPVRAELLKDAVGRKADITFDREYTLDLGGVRVRFLLVGPTHTRGDSGFFVEGDNVLFSGDVVMNQSFVAANASSSMKAWLAAFDTFEKLKPTVVVPAHGPIGDGSMIAVNRTFMLEIQARARELKAQGQTIDAVAATIQKEQQAKHPAFARANGVAGAARAAFNEAP